MPKLKEQKADVWFDEEIREKKRKELERERKRRLDRFAERIGVDVESLGRVNDVIVSLSDAELELLEAKAVRAGFAEIDDYLRFVAVHAVLESVNIKFHFDAENFEQENADAEKESETNESE